MTPKEKAEQLLNRMYNADANYNDRVAKQCALIAVDEIWDGIDKNFHAHPDKPHLSEMHWNKVKEYWEEVKKELESF